MKLTDLDACFVGHGGDGISNADGSPVPRREGCGIYFDCPCGCASPIYVPFENPLDGGPPVDIAGRGWTRSGDTIETLSLSPSILRRPVDGREGCSWHGWIRNGEAVTC